MSISISPEPKLPACRMTTKGRSAADAISLQADKAYHRVRETAEDAGLRPPRGAADRSLRLAMLDYFESCAAGAGQAEETPLLLKRMGVAAFVGIALGLVYLQVELLAHAGRHAV